MSNLIGPYQSSFLQKRQATDNAIIVQAIISHFRRMTGKMDNMMIKILRKGLR